MLHQSTPSAGFASTPTSMARTLSRLSPIDVSTNEPNNIPVTFTHLVAAITAGKYLQVSSIIYKNPKLLADTDEHGNTALMIAINTAHFKIIRKLINEPMLNLNAENAEGLSAKKLIHLRMATCQELFIKKDWQRRIEQIDKTNIFYKMKALGVLFQMPFEKAEEFVSSSHAKFHTWITHEGQAYQKVVLGFTRAGKIMIESEDCYADYKKAILELPRINRFKYSLLDLLFDQVKLLQPLLSYILLENTDLEDVQKAYCLYLANLQADAETFINNSYASMPPAPVMPMIVSDANAAPNVQRDVSPEPAAKRQRC
jgi:ankyrin repeat protein